MIDINTGSEMFTAYAFDVQGYVGTVTGDSIEGVQDAATIWPDVTRIDIYVTNEAVEGLWVGKYEVPSAEPLETNPQIDWLAEPPPVGRKGFGPNA